MTRGDRDCDYVVYLPIASTFVKVFDRGIEGGGQFVQTQKIRMRQHTRRRVKASVRLLPPVFYHSHEVYVHVQVEADGATTNIASALM